MRKLSFSVFTSAVTILCILGFIAMALKPHIPPPSANPIAREPGDFMKGATRHKIDWRPIGEIVFADARRLDRPLLLVIGQSWSATARQMDAEVFPAPEVANYINANFVPVRIDGTLQPAWTNAYLPLTRVTTGLRPDYQIWILAPDGAVIRSIYRRRASQSFDRTRFLAELVDASNLYGKVQREHSDTTDALRQAADRSQIRTTGTSSLPDLGIAIAAINATAHPVFGGFPREGYQDLYPHAWRLLALVGQSESLSASLKPALLSPIVDVLDGGFFVRARRDRWREIEFDKPAVLNAEMMSALLQSSAATQDPELQQIAEWTVRRTLFSLGSEFVSQYGLVQTARLGDEGPDLGRSLRSSFSPRRLREAVPNQELREWAFDNLGLRVETNRQMVPMLGSAAALNDPRLQEVLGALSGHYVTRRHFTTSLTMSSVATVAAREIEVARALGDKDALNRATDTLDYLERYRTADQVPHDLSAGTNHEYLGDYLAYADASLQDYLATGRVISLNRGYAVLKRALTVFKGEAPGQLLQTTQTSSLLIPNDPAVPEILDNFGESTTAAAIRLCSAYGRLLLSSGSETDRGLLLLRQAYAITAAYSDTAPPLGVFAAGYACAAAAIVDDRFAVAVGTNAQQLADELYRLRPTRMVAPVNGPVRSDLQSAAPGIYVFERGAPHGPLTVADAAARLPLTYDVGLVRADSGSNAP